MHYKGVLDEGGKNAENDKASEKEVKDNTLVIHVYVELHIHVTPVTIQCNMYM